MKINNKKGFTLVELLVVMTIIGIVMGMSIPLIRNLTARNDESIYSGYLNTVVNAAKLYVNSYGEDMFGRTDDDTPICNYITFNELFNKKLVKDFGLNDITCATSSTFVLVTKVGDHYKYQGYLGCANKSNTNKLVYTLPEKNKAKNEIDYATCSGPDSKASISISSNPISKDAKTDKALDVKIVIKSIAGVSRDFDLTYKWSTSNTDFSQEGMQTASFSIPTVTQQKLAIKEDPNGVIVNSYDIPTPSGVTGRYFLIVYTENLKDLYNNYWYNVKNESKYLALGPFTLDNTGPEIQSAQVLSTAVGYNNNTPRLDVTVRDTISVLDSDLKMCVSYDNYCTAWEDYDNDKQLSAIPGFEYNGSNYNIYFSVKDAAGNVSNRTITYKSYKLCDKQVEKGNWSGTCPSCGVASVTQTRDKVDEYFQNHKCGTATKDIPCSNPDCCTSTTVVCDNNWSAYSTCTKQCGKGTKYRTTTCKRISNFNSQDCGAETDTAWTQQIAYCNEQPCTPYLNTEEDVHLRSTCDSYDTLLHTDRNCTSTVVSEGSINFNNHVVKTFVGDEIDWLHYKTDSSGNVICNFIDSQSCSVASNNTFYFGTKVRAVKVYSRSSSKYSSVLWRSVVRGY